jgi:hypothetical protein
VQQAEQHVLGADGVVAHAQRLAQGELEDLLGRPVPAGEAAAASALRGAGALERAGAEDVLHLPPHLVQVDAERGEGLRVVRRPRDGVRGIVERADRAQECEQVHAVPSQRDLREALRPGEQRGEQVLAADVRRAGALRLELRALGERPGLVGEPLEHGDVLSEPVPAVLLVDRLAADVQLDGDLLPGPPLLAGVGHLQLLEGLEQSAQGGHRGQADARILAGGGRSDLRRLAHVNHG